ncbi:MAG: hypothetical protein KC619_24090 [Myxococcales bacterium]|nr:hypothetical protein [Myxococcales bacterium]
MSRIEQAGAENLVLDLAAGGKSTREIAARLKSDLGLEVSHATVARFLKAEAKDRRLGRQVVTSERAHVVAAKAGEEAVEHVDGLRQAAQALASMAIDGYRTVRVPGEGEVFEKVDAREQIQAARHLRTVAGYLIDLAADRPASTDAASLEAARKVIAEVFGYHIEPTATDEREAPPGDGEHTPPVLN